jgi:hypothetical protein
MHHSENCYLAVTFAGKVRYYTVTSVDYSCSGDDIEVIVG